MGVVPQLRSRLAISAVAIIGILVPTIAKSRQHPLEVAEIGSFYAGGSTVGLAKAPLRPRMGATEAGPPIDPNGEFERGQTYVHFVKLAHPRSRYPVLLWHGGSLTGTVYESTPDGREGWQQVFLRAGYSVFIVDAFREGRSGWVRYPELGPEPSFRTKAFAWETFRIGPQGSYSSSGSSRRGYADGRFPVSAFDDFAKALAPRFPIDPMGELSSYEEVLRRACPCVLVTHSASGPIGFTLAASHPDLVKGLVSIEPSGGPPQPVHTGDTATPAEGAASGDHGLPGRGRSAHGIDIPAPQGPHLIVWGDHLDLNKPDGDWSQLYASTKAYADHLRSTGVSVTWLDLPAEGVRGNSHMLMSDDNSTAIAERIDAWVKRNVR